MDKKRVINTPVKINAVNIDQFLKIASFIFDSIGKQVSNIVFNTTTTSRADIIGLLLIYKFYEFTVHKACFKEPKSIIKGYLSEELIRYGLKGLIDSFIKYKDPPYNKLKFEIKDKLFISPVLLERDSRIDEVSKAGNDICKFYENNKDIQYIVLTCMCELAQNFKSHAQSDTTSILSVTGNKDSFEIGCVDTGDGIITTLKNADDCANTTAPIKKLLLRSLEKGVTSKKTSSGHMGYGLWLIKELVIKSNGDLHIHSEGYYVKIHKGRIKAGISAYWKGTIVYLRLPLKQSHVLINEINDLRPKNKNIKIRRK